MTATEAAVVCELTSTIKWEPFGNVSWKDGEEAQRLSGSASRSEFKDLLPRIACVDGKRRLHDREESVPFSEFWIARDGSRAAISGGFVGGELLGWGGTCYFRRQGTAWVREGCVNEWSN